MTKREHKPMTIRALAAYWNKPIEEMLDMEISVGVRDGYQNFDSYRQDMNCPWINLYYGGPEGKTPYLRFDAMISDHRLVKVKKDAA
jgi:hypothetical protein